MAIAKDSLDRQDIVNKKVAERVGYSSTSTFSITFTCYVGRSPVATPERDATYAHAQPNAFFVPVAG